MNSENNNKQKQIPVLVAIMGVLTAILLVSVATLIIAGFVM